MSQVNEEEEIIQMNQIRVRESQDEDEEVMFLQNLHDESLTAGPLLASIQRNLDEVPIDLKTRMQNISTDEKHREEIIKVIGSDIPVQDMAIRIQALENERTPKEIVFVGNNDDEASSTRDGIQIEAQPASNATEPSSPTFDGEDKKVARERIRREEEQCKRAQQQSKTAILTEEEKLLVAMEKKGLKCPPKEERQAMIDRKHDRDHFGRDGTYQAILRRGYWWPKMRLDIEKTVADCDRCLRYTGARKRYHPLRPITAARPGDMYCIDILALPRSARGYTKMLVLVDVCTRFVVYWPVKNEGAAEYATALLRIFSFLGPCKVLTSDNGPGFRNEVIKAFTNLLQIYHRFSIEYHPQANGIVERFNSIFIRMLMKMTEGEGADWDTMAPFFQIVTNDHESRNSGYSAFYLLRGHDI